MELRVTWVGDGLPPGGDTEFGAGTSRPQVPDWILAVRGRPGSEWQFGLATDHTVDPVLNSEVWSFRRDGHTWYTLLAAALPSGAQAIRGRYSDLLSLSGGVTSLSPDPAGLSPARRRVMDQLVIKRVRVQRGRMTGQVELVVSEEGAPLLGLYLFCDMIGSRTLAQKLLSFAQGARKGEFLNVYDLFETDQDLAGAYRTDDLLSMVENLLKASTRAELVELAWDAAWGAPQPSPAGAVIPISAVAPPTGTSATEAPATVTDPHQASSPTDDQRFITEYGGSVAIDAGAGSGKTYVLIRRLLHLIGGGLKPEELVAVTFTEPAAAELRGRLQALLDEQAEATRRPELADAARRLPLAQISTIHALCARIVRDHPVESGAGLRFQVLEEAQARVWQDTVLPGILGALPEDAFGGLPAAQAMDAVQIMLRDPDRAETALAVSLSSFEQDLAALEEEEAGRAARSQQVWNAALETLREATCADPADPLELGRRRILAASEVTGSWPTRRAAMHAAVSSVRRNAGLAKVWRAGSKELVVAATETLRGLSAPGDAAEAALWQLRAAPVLGRLYAHVQSELDRLKAEQEILTFSDLERLAARALGHEEVRAYYHARWRAVCIDEFQDTSPLQWKILSALAPEGVNLTVVGDEKQSIYAFRGADVRLFQQARTRIEERGGANRALSRSFRTHADLVEVTNAFFGCFMPGPTGAGSTAATFRPLSAHRQEAPHPSPPCEFHVITGAPKVNTPELREAEAALIAHRIQSLLGEGRTVQEGATSRPLSFRDVAVLLRVRTNLYLYEEALFRAGIPYTVQGGRGLLGRPEVRDLTQLLQFLALPADDLALAAVLRSPLCGWSDTDLLQLTLERTREMTLWQTLEASEHDVGLLRDLLAARSGLPASALLSRALEKTEHAVVMAAMPDGQRRLANIGAFLSLLHSWAAQGEADVVSAASRVRDMVRLDLPVAEASLGSEDAVKIMTIHGSKGLEFPVVIVPDLLQQGRADSASLLMDAELGLALRVPGLAGDRQPAAHLRLQEVLAERRDSESERLMYVALTRAADALILTATAKSGQGREIERLAGFLPQENVVRLAYDHRRIPRPEPLRLQPQGRVHGAITGQGGALPETLPVTSLGVYLSCPRSFEYRYVSGRPPFTPLWQVNEVPGTGGVSGAVIGAAVHQAIELDWSKAMIQAGFPHLKPAERDEVSQLVLRLQTPAFAKLPATRPRREVPLSVPFEGFTFEGVIDADYGDWIVDYKTDRQVYPEHHAPQLALYLRATGATRASLAYLRHDLLYTLSADELAQGLSLAQSAAQGVQAQMFGATPSAEACRFCLHRGVCDQATPATASDVRGG